MARNNEDRFAAVSAEPAPQVMENATPNNDNQVFSFVTPTEFVDLPSKGKYYPEDHPLHNQDTLEIRYMTAKDEDILTSPSLLRKGLAVERLLQNVIVNKSVKTDDLLIGDKNAILVAARISGYGAQYETKITCPACGTTTPNTFDLNNISTNSGENIDIDENGHFVIRLPKMDVVVGVSFLTGADEKRLTKLAESRKKNNLPEANLTDQFRLFIRSVNGSTKQEHINSLIENMPAVDSRHLRTAYAELAPNVDLSQDFDCPSCGMQEEVNIPFTTEFFWPK